MNNDIVELKEDLSASPLYSEDLAPVPASGRTWNVWSIAAIWVGMAVCIPTYILASYMINSGLGWGTALVIIGLANLIVTIPMAFNGYAGVKYGIPFPVLGRASFGVHGVHIPAIIRGLVACGWFGIQTWIGGLAIYAIWCAATGTTAAAGLGVGKFVGFALFWLLNIFFIWKGTESIRWLESYAAPILVLIGLFLIGWGASNAGGFGVVLKQSAQMERASAQLTAAGDSFQLHLNPLAGLDGALKANAYRLAAGGMNLDDQAWHPLSADALTLDLAARTDLSAAWGDVPAVLVQFRNGAGDVSSAITAAPAGKGGGNWILYLLWLNAMVGFWATMAISISDITRYARSQKEQVSGQFLGLPGTMVLYSFVGVFVTCAALILFDDILIAEDAPWEPVSLLARFQNPLVVIVAQIFMLIATLSTNIAANVIAPANAFANAFPKQLSFRAGGVVTGLIGILICPWALLDHISGLLIFVSGFLGPVLGVLLADYFVVRKQTLSLADLYKLRGLYSFSGGFNIAGIAALAAGVVTAMLGLMVPSLSILYTISWFSGFAVAFLVYVLMMGRRPAQSPASSEGGV